MCSLLRCSFWLMVCSPCPKWPWLRRGKSRLQDWASKGNRKAKTALELANTPSHFLLAVQIGITLVVILAGAIGGRTLADQVAVSIAFFPSSNPTARPLPWRWLSLASPTFRCHRRIGSQASRCTLSRDSRDRRCHPPPLVLEDIRPRWFAS